MSGEKATSPCSKFQANIFNKSKCQNCFKSRELHLLTDHDMGQAKPVYGGWLCLAPEGTDFDNPMQRSRKWQRRFFILYERGSLSFALDELTSTLPQGTLNMNLCTEVVDAEPRTGQRNALCIVTPEQEIFIRGENKEIINGWSEQLTVYPRTNKQNQKKKRKVEPVTSQEPSPAKMAATSPCFPSMESAAEPGSSLWQEEQLGRGADVTPVWTVTHTDPLGPDQTAAGNMSRYLCPVSRESLASDDSWLSGSFSGSLSSLDSVTSGSTDPGDDRSAESQPNNMHTPTNNKREDTRPTEGPVDNLKLVDHLRPTERPVDHLRPTEGPVNLEVANSKATDKEQEGDPAVSREGRSEAPAVSREGRSEARTTKREKLQSCGDIDQLTAPPPQRRAKSLDRRTSESVMIPDLLNFKKGWMVKLDEEDQWKKYWFVLSTDSLRYYKDSIAEEASDLKGEIDLAKCYSVSEYQVQRNYGFQIHTQKAMFTLSAMTAGIRRNWIQALMKNVHPSNAPDVASLPGHHVPCGPPEALPKPDVTQDSSTEVPAEADQHPKHRSVMERRREGRYKTFDWAGFRPLTEPTSDTQRPKGPCLFELGDPERKKRREERRKRYESMLGFPLAWEVKGDGGGGRASSPRSQQKVEEEMERCWQQVERTVFRLDKTVPLHTEAKDTTEMERLLDSYRKGVEDLKVQLAESDHRRLELETELSTAGYHQQHILPLLDPPLSSEVDFGPLGTDEKPLNSHTQSLRDMYRETRELLQQQNMIRQSMQEQLGHALSSSAPQHPTECQTPTIWLHDTEGNLQELVDLLPGCPLTITTPLLSPALDSQCSLLQEGETRGPSMDSETTSLQQVLSSETLINSSEWSVEQSLQMEKTEGDDESLNSCESLNCVQQHVVPDQAMMRGLSQEVELLTSQNEALNQRNQEMLNQLTEADREIERLKAELSGRYTEHHHLPEVEQLSQTRAEDLEKELNVRNQQLLEAQSLIASLEERLGESEMQQQPREATQSDTGSAAEAEEAGEEKTNTLHYDKKTEGYFLRCFEATEAKLTELERQLCQSDVTCRELKTRNVELSEAERLYSQRMLEAEADIRRLNQELENERLKEGEKLPGGNVSVSGEERIQEVVEGMVMRLKALGRLLEVIDRLDLGVMKRSEESEQGVVVSQLKWEEEFWGMLLNELKVSSSQLSKEKDVEVLLSEVTEHLVVEKQMLLLAHDLLSETDSRADDGREPLKDFDIIGNIASVTVSENEQTDDNSGIFDLSSRHGDRSIKRHLTEVTQKMSLLNHIAASVGNSSKLQFMAHRLCDFHISQHPWSHVIASAAAEALHCCHISRLHSVYRREIEETKQRLSLTSSLICSNCAGLMSENEELRVRLSNLEQQRIPSLDAEMPILSKTDSYRQDTENELQVADRTDVNIAEEMEEEDQKKETAAEEKAQEFEMVEGESLLAGAMEIPVSSVEDERASQEKISDENTETNAEAGASLEPEEVVLLRRRVTELEEQLFVLAEQMKAELHMEMSCVQLQHEKEMDKLKVTCERGFAAMEECHQKVLEELQRRQQQQVQRLLLERDRLLEEEAAATATAIEAIENAHRLELEREVQRRHRSENSTGNTELEEIRRQHGEELASCERELDVLSQQYSLKCLESGHLAQALDAERKALCQCQQENQDLRTRNQELSAHLAVEITRLCSRAQQDAAPLCQGTDVYRMEITLRVKESEVQCLKQEITSLKDELQSAQTDKRSATKTYKDVCSELSVARAKAEWDLGQLRENLRLAHQALGEQHAP